MNSFLIDRHGKPIFLLGLQSHNSSSQTTMIEKSIQAIKRYGGNLLEAPVYWCKVEPKEGIFDFSLVRELIDQARQAHLHLILLWFATSKNGHPTYAPDDIKLNPDRYPMALGADLAPVASLSPHYASTLERDQKAFCRMLECVRDYDQNERTVVAVQIENEMGLANTDRDYSPQAEKDFAQPVPPKLADVKLEDCGETDDTATWRGRFGRHAHEAFSAWHHARFVENIAAAGKKIYDLPLITNVMIGEQGIEEAGKNYNAGAAVGRVLDIWKEGAPHLDLICPDIYTAVRQSYLRIAARYDRPDNALFIPESPPTGDANALNALVAVAVHGAIGLCGFGAESTLADNLEPTPPARSMIATMKTMANLSPLLIKYRNSGRVHAFTQDEYALTQYLKLADYHVEAHFFRGNPGHFNLGSRINSRIPENQHLREIRGRGLLVQTNAHEFFLAGAGMALEFTRRPQPQDPRPFPHLNSRQASQLNFLAIEEGHFEDDRWVVDYQRNGDEANFAHYVHEGQAIRIALNPSLGMTR